MAAKWFWFPLAVSFCKSKIVFVKVILILIVDIVRNVEEVVESDQIELSCELKKFVEERNYKKEEKKVSERNKDIEYVSDFGNSQEDRLTTECDHQPKLSLTFCGFQKNSK